MSNSKLDTLLDLLENEHFKSISTVFYQEGYQAAISDLLDNYRDMGVSDEEASKKTSELINKNIRKLKDSKKDNK